MLINMKKILNFFKKNINIFIFILIVLFLVILMFIFPLLGDDLLHGRVGVGIHFMSGVNGRYLGNLFGINLSSNIFIRVIVKVIIICLIVFFSSKIVNKKQSIYFLISLSILLLMPKEIFRQVIVNSSGFGNYVVPIIGILFIIYSHLKGKYNTSNVIWYILFFGVGIFNSLFVEHITIYNFLLSLYLLVYSFKKKNKDKFLYLTFFVGSLIGSVIMFTNPIYFVSMTGNDNYRSITALGDIFNKLFIIINESFFINYFIVILMIILSIIVCKIVKRKEFKILHLYNLIFLVYYLLKILNPTWMIFGSKTIYFEGIITLVLFLNIIFIVLNSCLKNDQKYSLVLFLVSFVLTLIPLLVVNPIGARCYFGGYIFLLLFCLKLICILVEENFMNKQNIKILSCFLLLIIFSFYFSIYGKIYIASNKRLEYINTNISNGASNVLFTSLPYENYLHGAEIWPEYNILVYKLYYNIDIKVEFIPN